MGGGPRIESRDAVVAGCPAVEFASSVEPTVQLPSVVPLVCWKGAASGGWPCCSDKRNKGDLGRDSPSHADWQNEDATDDGGNLWRFRSLNWVPAVGDRAPRCTDACMDKETRTAGGSVAFGGWRVRPTDLEVGGRYTIPRKQKK